ncbi:MAG: hypothetical protein JNN11_05525 [Candidatus Doudnabacteria bacterium]|nr:hypothetical protein [Candidatus Doudnabacteria bacterium]
MPGYGSGERFEPSILPPEDIEKNRVDVRRMQDIQAMAEGRIKATVEDMEEAVLELEKLVKSIEDQAAANPNTIVSAAYGYRITISKLKERLGDLRMGKIKDQVSNPGVIGRLKRLIKNKR